MIALEVCAGGGSGFSGNVLCCGGFVSVGHVTFEEPKSKINAPFSVGEEGAGFAEGVCVKSTSSFELLSKRSKLN